MSGGVDSSMALVLLKKQGWQPIGVSLKYAIWQDKKNLLRENACCSTESFEIARSVCKKLNVPYYIFDVSQEFKQKVINYFISELKDNRTPNPCIICNRHLKFKKLFEWAENHNIKYVATGHYARVKQNLKTNKYELRKAKDFNKDQTYSLSFLPQKWLKNIIFPLGNYIKEEIFKLAKDEGFDFYLKRKQSQDFCFVASKCLNCFLEKEIGKKEGVIKDTAGKILGKHQGLHFYTFGQRKGINLFGGPYFVIDKILENNTLVVSKNEQDLLAKETLLSPFNFISGGRIKEKMNIWIKIRSQHNPAKAILIPISNGRIKIVFDKRQKSITPGQFAVFYQKEVCLGGGRIIKTN
jgi:tRNA-specific 2-thiouridylase